MEIDINETDAQTFIKDLIALCNQHRICVVSHGYDPLALERMSDGQSVVGVEPADRMINYMNDVAFKLRIRP